MNEPTEKQKLEAIINHFGKELQWLKLSEECGEVHKAICRYEYGAEPTTTEIAEEIADLKVITEQIIVMYNLDRDHIYNTMEAKIERTLQRYNININN